MKPGQTVRCLFLVFALLSQPFHGSANAEVPTGEVHGPSSTIPGINAESLELGRGPTVDVPCPTGVPPWNAEDLPPVIPGICSFVGQVILDHGVGLVVGPPGTGVGSDALVDEGTHTGGQEFAETTLPDGTVVLLEVGDEEETSFEPPAGGGGGLDPCKDDESNYEPSAEHDMHRWYTKDSSYPVGMNQTEVTDAMRNAIRNVTHAYNDCDLPDKVGASSNYEGVTTNSADLDEGKCDGYFDKDERNVTDFGFLAQGEHGRFLAKTCYWYVGSETVEADVRFDASAVWTLNPDTGCSGKYDLESVATHERGHTFGLGHVGTRSDVTHSKLTMYPGVEECDTRHRTLGLGDIRGLMGLFYDDSGGPDSV
jgi:Matrixin